MIYLALTAVSPSSNKVNCDLLAFSIILSYILFLLTGSNLLLPELPGAVLESII